MGTATYSIAKAGVNNPRVRGKYVAGGSHSTTTTGSGITGVTGRQGDILSILPDEDMRVMFGGVTATQTLGHLCPAGVMSDLSISGDGAISVCDVA